MEAVLQTSMGCTVPLDNPPHPITRVVVIACLLHLIPTATFGYLEARPFTLAVSLLFRMITNKKGLYFNDLWKYASNQWTWVGGSTSTDKNGVYGTQGVASLFTYPGSRALSDGRFDSNGNFLLFGGVGQSGEDKMRLFTDSERILERHVGIYASSSTVNTHTNQQHSDKL